MKPECYQLFFKAPLAVDCPAGRMKTAVVHSDTFYSAVFSVWARLFDNVEERISDPRFFISSLYPFYIVSGKVVYFLPMPLEISHDRMSHDGLSGIKLISSELLIPLCRGQRLPVKDYSRFHGGAACCQEPVESGMKFFEPGLMTRRFSDRGCSVPAGVNNEAEIRFSKRSGLFFLAWFHDDAAKQNFEAALKLLADEGLGGMRSLGRGTLSAAAKGFSNSPGATVTNTFCFRFTCLRRKSFQTISKSKNPLIRLSCAAAPG